MRRRLLHLVGLSLILFADGVAQQPLTNLYGTDGAVYGMGVKGNTLYVGGVFTSVGYVGGQIYLVDSVVGKPNTSFPRGIGSGDQLQTVISDDNGGWFIGGQFTPTAVNPSKYIRHIRADLTVDTSWNIKADGMVLSLAKLGDTLFVGGVFTTIQNQTRGHAAAFLISSRTLTAWDPKAAEPVTSLLPIGGSIYVGGFGCVLVDSKFGQVQWGAALTYDYGNYAIRSIVRMNGNVYISGSFFKADTVSRLGLAAYNEQTHKLLPWNPTAKLKRNSNLLPGVTSIIGAGDRIYLAGAFDSAYGQERRGFAAVDTTGQLLPWSPKAFGVVTRMVRSGNAIYAIGQFDTVNGSVQRGVAAVDTTGALLPWNPRPSGYPSQIWVGGGRVVFGGFPCTMIDVQPRRNAAAFDVTTGKPTAWDPSPDSKVLAIAATPTNIAIGGEFSFVGGKLKTFLAFVDDIAGASLFAGPDPGSPVNCLALSGTTVYAGGAFSKIGPTSGRTFAAAWNSSTGALLPWSPRITNVVSSIAQYGSNVYVSGYFDSAGTAARNGLACLDATTGLATSWNPQPSGVVLAIAPTSSAIYIGGKFTTLGASGTVRSHIAAVDPTNGAPLPWNPGADADVNALLVKSGNGWSGNVVAGGMFSTVGGASRPFLAVLDPTTGTATSWNAGKIMAYGPNVVASSANSLFIGGDFYEAGDRAAGYIAGFTGTPLTSVQLTDQAASIPSGFSLEQNYPNPFNPTTKITYAVPSPAGSNPSAGSANHDAELMLSASRIRLTVYDLLGREVAVLVDGMQTPGRHEVVFDAGNLSSGIYFYSLSSQSTVQTMKMILMK